MEINVNVYHHFKDAPSEGILKEILNYVINQSKTLHTMATTLDQVLQDVQDESTQEDSLIALVSGLEKQIADALSGATLPPAVQAKVDAVFQAVETNKAKVAAAVSAGTQPAAGGSGSGSTGTGSTGTGSTGTGTTGTTGDGTTPSGSSSPASNG